ncbi:MAG TPA: hypothetical protein VD886_24315, partial [Herpetosiphonaceae bacterium]|nr:hypothetical protein [Herpetosiphonaceae bacterium]
PGLHSYGAADLNVLSDTAVQLTYQGRTITVNRVLDFLDLSVSVPQDNTHYGMLGTPNGDAADDFRYPDGTPARDAFDMADAWRITDPAHSLFTYQPGEGPHTFNLEQINQPPSSAELAPYVDQARDLLLATCRTDSLSQVAVNNVALELLTGREPRELASSGLCWFTIEGTVYNSLVPGLPVPGAKVVVTSAQLMSCETTTDRDGRYRCDLAATGELPTVTATVRKRGQGSATVSISELPPMGGYLATELNLSAAPTTLHLNGVVQDAGNRPLYNAQLRLAGPQDGGSATAYAQTDGDGRYSAYLMVDDGVLDGQVGYNVRYSPSWSTDPDAAGVSQTLTRSLPPLQANALNPISETLTLSGGLARFSGRIAYQRAPELTLPGLRVRITPTAPVAGWTICDVRTNGDGEYACEVALGAGDPFQVMIEVGGEPMAGPITVDPAGRGVGEVIPVVTNIQIPSGLLVLGGLVRGADGAPVSGADIHLSAAGLLHSADARTDASGRYTVTVGLRASASQLDATLGVSYGTLKRSEIVSLSGLDPAAVNQRAHDLALSGSSLRFSGAVINSLAPGAPLTGTVVISSSAGLLCSAAISRNAYECVASLDAFGAEPLDISYAVSGPWGGAIETAHLGSLPPLGEERGVSRDFSLALTTLRLAGAVRTSAGAPLAGATVRVASGGAVEGKTNAEGRYDLLLTLAEGQDVRGLEYAVLYRTAVIRQSASVSAPAGQLTA